MKLQWLTSWDTIFWESPSMRREWIEISVRHVNYIACLCLPPCGGSGLKFLERSKALEAQKVSLHAEGVD